MNSQILSIRLAAQICCIFSLIGLSLSSCTIEKRLHRPGYHVEWAKSSHGNQKQSKLKSKESEKESLGEVKKRDAENQLQRNIVIDDQLHAQSSSINTTLISNVNKHFLDVYQQFPCDTLVLNDMTKIAVNLVEIGIHELMFKDCGRSVGKTFTLSKSKVTRIIYADGTDEQIYYNEGLDYGKQRNSLNSVFDDAQEARSPEIVGIFSLVFGLFANFSAAIALFSTPNPILFTATALIYGIIALSTGIVSLSKISSSPNSYSGRGAAILGLILGIINIVFAILVFTTVLVLLTW